VAAHRVGAHAELSASGRLVVDVGGRSVGVFEVDGELFALRNRCPHQGGPLCDGVVMPALLCELSADGIPREYLDEKQKVICCPWHGVEFDLRTGECLADPSQRVRTYATYVEGEDVYVEIP
jgi:nitrite reductase/ring-hydroxylating ferredoxin subunit